MAEKTHFLDSLKKRQSIRVSIRFSRPSATVYRQLDMVLLGFPSIFTEFFLWISRKVTLDRWLLPGLDWVSTKFNRVHSFHLSRLGPVRLSWVLPSSTEFYWVLPGYKQLFCGLDGFL